jgi:RNA polymerase sigma-70 factor (ECF subfamily)
LEAWLAGSHTPASEQVIRQEQLLQLAQALAQLPDDQRQAVEWRYFQEQPLAAIAEAMQRTEPSVAGLLRRGLKRLREILSERE